eukprot:GHUV01056798.1.p1 GENE.GHUV01056798.1~~GHUV01056798.1.p1  ORF type:complete len:139 (-),score=17.83 GHUV01056798.1:308-724(-)
MWCYCVMLQSGHLFSLLLVAGNWRSALQDSQSAHNLDPSNLKAIFRGARAALKLGEWDTCEQLLAAGLSIEPNAPELLQIQKVTVITVLLSYFWGVGLIGMYVYCDVGVFEMVSASVPLTRECIECVWAFSGSGAVAC